MAEPNLPTISKPQIASNQRALRQQEPDCVGLVAVAQPISCEVSPSIHILRLPDVMKRTGICRASIYQHMASGVFPKSISLGARSVGWLEHEIDAWLAAKIQARGKGVKFLTEH